MYAQQIYVHLTVVGNIPLLQHFLISSNGFLQTCSTVRWEDSCFSMQNLITPLTEDKGRMKRVQHVRDQTHPPPGMTTGLGVSSLLLEGLNGPT